MKLRKTVAGIALAATMFTVAACGTDTTSATDTATTSSSQSDTAESSGSTSSEDSATAEMPAGGTPPEGAPDGRGGPGGLDVSSVSTEDQLVELIQEAYGDAGLGLHRGHQPVQDVLDEVLTISHDELHVRMEEQGQNLATIADDVGVDQQTLIDALVESWSPAIDNLLEAGTITQAEADAYLEALEEAFTFRVTWDGSEETPTYSGLDA